MSTFQIDPIVAVAVELSEFYSEISVGCHESEGGEHYWSVYTDPEGFWDVVDGRVLAELHNDFDQYGVTIYHRDGTPWS